ncbi:MAG: hypothetical protein M3O15_15695, partial [Acidobacteriota bacterium]|nr:hypothetical protein [Acidobacteriota bacterium]
IWPAQGAGDDRMLAELRSRDVRWALLEDWSVDSRPELRFAVSHPKVAAYLAGSFEDVTPPRLAQLWHTALLRRRVVGPFASIVAGGWRGGEGSRGKRAAGATAGCPLMRTGCSIR